MFEGIKKKFSNFIDSFSKKEEDIAEEAVSAPETEPQKERHEVPEAHEPKSEALAPEQHAPKRKRPEEHVSKANAMPPHSAAKASQPRVGIATKLKGTILREVSISDSDLEPFLDDLRSSLIQSDVNYGAAERIIDHMRKDLLSRKLSVKGIDKEVKGILRTALLEILDKGAGIDILALAAEAKRNGQLPFKILFLGPNGAGKTTTMAKIAHLYIKNGFACVFSASDTFRAAAVEQTLHHAKMLGINAIKGAHGADPASVAFDAIAHARAHGIEVVLIDSAGRQETNRSLMEEVKKMVRVAKPDLKIFIGEGIAGNALLEQVTQFKEACGLDGVILTKLDCDAKGGNTLSILSESSVPVLFFGTGEGYADLVTYNASDVIAGILGE